jgi:hypothetical protein
VWWRRSFQRQKNGRDCRKVAGSVLSPLLGVKREASQTRVELESDALISKEAPKAWCRS